MDQAVDLVTTVIDYSAGGDTVIPELPAYRLGDLATAMGLQMSVKGLPAWEKKHEGMDFGNTSDIARRMSVQEISMELLRT